MDNNLINQAVDMGWRFESHYGELWLMPPEGAPFEGVARTAKIPSCLEAWVVARTIGDPDQSKRHHLESKVKTWYNVQWPMYLIECENDDAYAESVIIEDAQSDFDIDYYQAKDWFHARQG